MLKNNVLEFVKEINIVEDLPHDSFGSISLIKMTQKDGSIKWKISRGNSDLSKNIFLFCISPLPSSRNEEYFKEFRFDSPEEAINCFKEFFVVAKKEKVMNLKMLDAWENQFQYFLNQTGY